MKKSIIFLFLLSVTLSAQTNIYNSLDREITQHLFNGDWQKSDSLITMKLNKSPNSLKYNFLKSYNYFYTRYVGNNNPYSRDETIRQVRKFAWDAIKHGEKLEENAENNFYLGSAYSLLARADVMEQKFWEGYWNASKSENHFDDALDEDPNLIDAYLNLGVYEYFPAVNNVNWYQSVLVWLGGMSGDREAGLNHFKNVSEKGKLYKNEANYILGILYNFNESDLKLAYETWKNLHNQFPGNNGFLTQMDRAYLGKLVDEKGVGFLKTEFDSLETLYSITNPNVLNILGYNLMNRNKMDDALVVFKTNIKKYPDVANGYDSLAECYLNRGDNENAIKYYKMAFEKLPADTTINDQFRTFLEEGIRNNLNELGSQLDI